jgi:hypothetical protein
MLQHGNRNNQPKSGLKRSTFKTISMIKTLVLCCFCCVAFLTKAQQKITTSKYPTYFGICASPVIPNDFIGAKNTYFEDSTGAMQTTFTNKMGYTFGGIIRIGITKNIALETGLYQVRRVYNAQVNIPDSGIYRSQQLAFVNYDIPINGMIHVQMDQQWFMNANLGVSINQYPSDVRDSIIPGPGKSILVEGRRTNRTYFSTNAGIGFEYRTNKAGIFYFGVGAKVPFRPILFGVSILKQSGTGNKMVAYKPITAGYFTFDLRYYLPTQKKRNITFPKGPVE